MSIKYKLATTIILLATMPLVFIMLIAFQHPETPIYLLHIMQVALIGTFILASATSLFINSKVVLPLNQLKTILTRAQQGDLNFKEVSFKEQDEMGTLSNFTQQFLSKIREVVNNLSIDIEKLRRSSDFLFSMSGQTINESYQSITVNQMNNNIGSIAMSIEQMSYSIQEISEVASQVALNTDQAFDMTEKMKSSIQHLLKNIQNINQLVEVINKIAEQTNLLALNASIEAARAGDAGKGFQIVANEVKALARNTQKEADNISNMISSIQSESQETFKEIEKLAKITENISFSQTSVASAVDEQANVSKDMQRHIDEVVKNSSDIKENAQSVANDIGTIVMTLQKLLSQLQQDKQGKIQDLIVWSDHFSVGIESMDNQHKVLVKLINQLYSSLQKSRITPQELEEVLSELVKYVDIHFTSEEKLMEKYNYPDYHQHLQQHKKFINAVTAFKDDYHKGISNIDFSLLNFLRSWLLEHILEEDKHYGDYIAEHK